MQTNFFGMKFPHVRETINYAELFEVKNEPPPTLEGIGPPNCGSGLSSGSLVPLAGESQVFPRNQHGRQSISLLIPWS